MQSKKDIQSTVHDMVKPLVWDFPEAREKLVVCLM